MNRTRTVSAAAILLLIGSVAASSGAGQMTTKTTQMQTTLKAAPPPAPVITAWGPQDKVATGEIIWVQGTNLKRDLLVLTFGDRAIMPHLYFEMLPVPSSTAARVEFRTSAAMKTGVQTSTPLKVLHRGGAPVVLDADYHVVDRDARFSGASRWHKGNTSSYGVFTEGKVTIVLNNLDFGNEGSGTFDEEVRIIDTVRTTTEPCPAPFNLQRKTLFHMDWMSVRSQPVQRRITWKRDPAIPNRIVLYGVGTDAEGATGQRVNATAELASIDSLQLGFIIQVEAYAPKTNEWGCGPEALKPPTFPSYPAFVSYSLRRAI